MVSCALKECIVFFLNNRRSFETDHSRVTSRREVLSYEDERREAKVIHTS